MPVRMRSFATPNDLVEFVNNALEATGQTLNGGGLGYTALDILTVQGGTYYTPARIRVDTVDGSGTILTATLVHAGEYTALPGNPASVTGGTGSGATFNLSGSQALLAQADVDEITPRSGRWHLNYWV